MNSKDKGNIGESVALTEFTKRGIQVSIPFGDNARYDLIADFNGKLNKIQVKYCNQEVVNGSICCPCASSTNHTTNKHYDTYENDIDYFVFYLAEWDETLIVPIEIIGDKKSICFRQTIPIASKNYNLVSDYTFKKFFKEENSIKVEKSPLLLYKNKCIDCGTPISDNATRCRSCVAKMQPRKVERPSREELKELIRHTPFTKIGEQYGVSDKAITKWCIAEKLPSRKKDILLYSDEEWKNI
jgi:hypothetical protein